MIYAVVPVFNEESRVGRLLGHLLALPALDQICVILNGSNERTRAEVKEVQRACPWRIRVVCFEQPLGIDVPRAVGAVLALGEGADYTLFIDGDMVGEITADLSALLAGALREKVDLALTDCYPHPPAAELRNEPLFYFAAC
jgi:glycosyltransferase involved in cell wall biosynthesis